MTFNRIDFDNDKPLNTLRTDERWLIPTEEGKKELGLKRPHLVEIGVAPFLHARLGHKGFERDVVRFKETINRKFKKIKWVHGATVEITRRDGLPVILATIEDRPSQKAWRTKQDLNAGRRKQRNGHQL